MDRGAIRPLVIALICACGVVCGAIHAQQPGSVVLIGGRVIASPEAPPLENAAVVLTGGRIAAVGPASRVATPTSATVIDCAGMVLVAGFQNSHVHFTEDAWTDAATRPAPALARQLDAMVTSRGFTTVVDTASLLENTNAIRRRIESGEIAGPRILTSGLALYPPEGVPYYVREALPTSVIALLPQPATADAAAQIVRRQLDGGADIVKLFTGSWTSRERVQPMPVDLAAAAVAEAHRRGRLVLAHPSNVAGLEVALDARVDVLAHAIDDVTGLAPTHLARMKAQDVALVPTLTLLASDGRRAVLDQVRDYGRAGGQILFGTDVGYRPDYDTTREFELLEATGLSWRQILASLTTAPARRFKEDARRGRIAPGMEADIVVLGSDPARGAKAFADVQYTIRAGRIVHQR